METIKIEEIESQAAAGNQTQDTSGLPLNYDNLTTSCMNLSKIKQLQDWQEETVYALGSVLIRHDEAPGRPPCIVVHSHIHVHEISTKSLKRKPKMSY